MSKIIEDANESDESYEADMRPPELVVDLRGGIEDACRITVSGELDMASAPKLHGHLIQAFQDESSSVVIDLRDISFIDSTGLGVLVTARQRAKSSGISMTMHLPEGAARFPFQVTGLADSLSNPSS